MRNFLFAAFLIQTSFVLTAQVTITNPGFSGVEKLVYNDQRGDKRATMTQTLRVAGTAAEPLLELSVVSEGSNSVVVLNGRTLATVSADATTVSPEAKIRRRTDYLDVRAKAKPGELLVQDTEALTTLLRGFPWGTADSVKLAFLSTGGGAGLDFSFTLKVSGRQTIQAGGRSWECWKAELGLEGMWGALFGKSQLWYAVEAPHVLVKSQGPLGGPGSPLRVLELQSVTRTP